MLRNLWPNISPHNGDKLRTDDGSSSPLRLIIEMHSA